MTAWAPQPGERVKFGAFDVEVRENLGYAIRIQSFGKPSFSMSVPLAALTRISPPPSLKIEISIPEPINAGGGTAEHVKRRAVLDALRFGLVPLAAARDLTIGYDQFAGWARRQMPTPEGVRLAAVSGPFGSGKSHAMALMRQMARELGALTAHVEIDGREITLADPDAILRSLWPTLDGDGLERAHSLLSLHVEAMRRGFSNWRSSRVNIDRVRDNHTLVRQLQDVDALDHFADDLDAVMASAQTPTASSLQAAIFQHLARGRDIAQHEVVVRPMIGRKVDDRPLDFVAALLGYARLAEAAGWPGLLVTIDEFEIHGLSTSSAKVRAISILMALAKLKDDQLGLGSAPLSIVFGTIDDPGNEVASRLTEIVVGDRPDAYWKLPEITAPGRKELADRIARLHSEAYGGPPSAPAAVVAVSEQAIANASETVRPFIKRLVWELDCLAARRGHQQ